MKESYRCKLKSLLLCLLLASLMLSLPATADAVKFEVSGYNVTGDNPLSESHTKKILKPFTGEQEDIEGLQSASAALEQALRDKGYNFSRVVLPQQSLSGGVIELRVVAFKLGKVTIEGARFYDEANIRASLPALVEGTAPNSRKLSRSIAVGKKQPSKSTRLTFNASEQRGEVDARITIKDRRPWQVFSWLNNTGTDETGRTRLGFGLQHSNLFNRDHNAILTYTLSPEEFDSAVQYGLLYQMPFYGHGATLDFLYSKSNVDTGTVASFFDVAGKGEVFGGTYNKTFSRRGGYSHEMAISVFDKLFENDVVFQGIQIGANVRSRPLGIRYGGSLEKPGYQLEFFVRPQVNLPGGSRNSDLYYGLSRLGAKSDWSLMRVALTGRKHFGQWSSEAQISGQLANQPLIAGEQFGAGGVNSVRGFQEREVSGDKGIRYSIQVLAPPLGRQKVRALAFVDGAETRLEDALLGEIDRESIVSTGLGVRWSWRKWFSLKLDWGYVLDGVDDRRPDGTADGDSRIHFNLFARY